MKRCAVVLSLAACAVCALGQWKIGEPVVSYWAGPGYPGDAQLTDASLEQLKEGGFNTAWATTVEEMDLAQRHGMRVIYCSDNIQNAGAPDNPELLKKLQAAVDRVKNHPALYVYFITDEPPATEFPKWSRVAECVRQRDPTHACWANLQPTYANNSQLGMEANIKDAYWEHLRLFAEQFRPEFITYDHYQFMRNGDTPNYFLNLAMVQERAFAQGIPFWNGVQACTWVPGSAASPSAPRITETDELRYLIYTSAAYGAHGIYYYVYSHRGHEGTIVSLDGKPSAKFNSLKTLNREFIALVKELAPYKFVGAYHNGIQSPGVTPYGAEAILTLSPSVPNVPIKPLQYLAGSTLVSRFDKPGTATPEGSCFVVVNLDYKADRDITVTAPLAMERFEPLSGKWTSVNGRSAALHLIRGGGVLLRLTK